MLKEILKKSFVICFILINFLYALPAWDNDPDYKTYRGQAYIHTNDPDGNPVANVRVNFIVRMWFIEGYETDAVSGYTDANGFAYLYIDIKVPRTWGGFTGRYLASGMTDDDYTIVSSVGTSTSGDFSIWPEYSVGLDQDHNKIADAWELSLASKFCPILKLHSGDQGVRPVPVEIMDRNSDGVLDKFDLLIDVYNLAAQFVTTKSISDFYIYDGSTWYWMPNVYSFNSGAVLKYMCTATDLAAQIYVLVPHFEWGEVEQTTGSAWYSTWSQKMVSHPESAYQDGTTYAHLFKHGTNTVIQYWFFYPFNHAANRHEGDWEHINVVVNSQNPNNAAIIEVEYWGHYTQCYERNANEAEITSGTHPVVYVAGRTDVLNTAGNGSHANYPESGSFPVGGGVNEIVDGNGIQINFNGYENLILIPNKAFIDYNDINLGWMHFPSFWGHIQSYPSVGSQAIPFAALWDDFMDYLNVNTEDEIRSWSYKLRNSNIAPFSPYWQTKWEVVH